MIAFFIICAAVCAVLSIFVGVNYKFEDYLPDDAKSTHALDVMYEGYAPGDSESEGAHL